MTFEHAPHPRTQAHKDGTLAPPRTTDERSGLNGKVGLFITTVVGTMWAAYLFTILALVSAPSAFASGNKLIIVAWVAQTFLQLVLLPILLVGQNIQAKASDKRAESTLKDAEAVLHECLQIQAHLHEQDLLLARPVMGPPVFPSVSYTGTASDSTWEPVAKVTNITNAPKKTTARKPAKKATPVKRPRKAT